MAALLFVLIHIPEDGIPVMDAVRMNEQPMAELEKVV